LVSAQILGHLLHDAMYFLGRLKSPNSRKSLMVGSARQFEDTTILFLDFLARKPIGLAYPGLLGKLP
jgi:hypothetical protein